MREKKQKYTPQNTIDIYNSLKINASSEEIASVLEAIDNVKTNKDLLTKIVRKERIEHGN